MPLSLSVTFFIFIANLPSLPCAHTALSLSHTHAHTHSSLSLTHTRTHARTHTRTHTHTRALAITIRQQDLDEHCTHPMPLSSTLPTTSRSKVKFSKNCHVHPPVTNHHIKEGGFSWSDLNIDTRH